MRLPNVRDGESVISTRRIVEGPVMTIEFESFTTESPEPARSSRRRGAAAVGATMLVAAAGGIGFGIGRAADDNDAITAADSPVPAVPETMAPVPETTFAPDRAASPPTDEPATTEGIDVAMTEIAASGGGGWTIFGGETMTLLTERTTESGAILRAHLGETWDHEIYDDFGEGDDYGEFGGPDGWQPPGWCFESGQVRIALGGGESTGTSVIDVGSVSWWSEPFNGRAVSSLTMGSADANPYRVLFVQAPPSVSEVTVTFGDGATDSTTPTDGVALLAVAGTDATSESELGWLPPPTDFEIVFTDATGESVDVAGDRTGYNDPAYQASCSPPPPALPDPGEQPGDPAAEQQTIVELMTAIYLDDDDTANTDRFDDATGIAEAREQVRSGSFEEAAANAEAVVEELVFTSPTEAWFRYRIETTTGTFAGRFGIAVNIDGDWKITRSTICQDLSLAGGDCGGNLEMIQPPGS